MSEPAPLGYRARQLRNVAEPIAALVFFAPEAHAAYAQLGFADQSEGELDGIALFEWDVYFLSRAACMGTSMAKSQPRPSASSHVTGWRTRSPRDGSSPILPASSPPGSMVLSLPWSGSSAVSRTALTRR
jgi:hypothetical protein